MIDGKKNMITTPCNTVNKQTPYFKDWDSFNAELGNKYGSPDEYLFEHLNVLERTEIDYFDRYMDDNKDVKALPDAVYRVSEANSKHLRYGAAVNDEHVW